MRYLIYFTCLALLAACNKDEEQETTGSQVNETPATFTQKVLIEIFTGAGQPQCTDGFVKAGDIISQYPATAIPLYIHYSDAMEVSHYTKLESSFNNGNPPSFPSAMINRTPSLNMVILNRTQWMSNFNTAKNKTASCGLSVHTSVSGNMAEIRVSAAGNISGADYKLHVMLAENDVKGTGSLYDQRNAYNNTAGHTFYNAGDPIAGFSHAYVLRSVLSNDDGDAITIGTGTQTSKTYQWDISGFNADKTYVVAFIAAAGPPPLQAEILNVQRVKLGESIDFD